MEVFYPQAPTGLPKNFTALPSSYKLKVATAIAAIVLFVLLYISLVIAMGYLLYYAVTYDMISINKLTILLKIGAIAGAGMLLVFTLKFAFKLKNIQPDNRVKIDLAKNPKLKSFVDNICKETGAPKPKYVYADPDVNAYVSYSNMWLSLFLPVKKNLTIGLGLVSCLNLTEFKAVVAHEFGHFAQRSMKVGSYINSANTIIFDMIYSRDSWDRALDTWRSSDIRLAAAAWVITPVIWVIRQLLSLFYQFLNIVYSSLRREMEFNADKVAVSTAGSESIVSALWKLDSGSVCWNDTINHLYAASQKNMYVNNAYTHNNNSYAIVKSALQETFNQMKDDDRGGKMYFETSADSKVGMYTSHPPNDHREHNAKTPFIPCNMDERSAWVLFDDKESLQSELTKMVYKNYLAKTPETFVTEKEFHAFITAETDGKDLLASYHNAFNDRFVQIPDEAALRNAGLTAGSDSKFVEKLKEELLVLMTPVNDLNKAISTVQQIAEGTSTLKSFSFKGQEYNKKNMQLAYEKILIDRNDLFLNGFKEWDLMFFATHLNIAKNTGKEMELLKRYHFHNLLTAFYEYLMNSQSNIYKDLDKLQSEGDITEFQLADLSKRINNTFAHINQQLRQLDDTVFVKLSNIDTAEELRNVIIENGTFTERSANLFHTGLIDKLLNELAQAIAHLQRIEQKSMLSILKFHKEL